MVHSPRVEDCICLIMKERSMWVKRRVASVGQLFHTSKKKRGRPVGDYFIPCHHHDSTFPECLTVTPLFFNFSSLLILFFSSHILPFITSLTLVGEVF